MSYCMDCRCLISVFPEDHDVPRDPSECPSCGGREQYEPVDADDLAENDIDAGAEF